MGNPDRVRFEWRMEPGEDAEALVVLLDLRERGGEVSEINQQPPDQLEVVFLPIIAGAIGVVALAEAVVKFRRRRAAEHRMDEERVKGGWIVDARRMEVQVTRSVDVPYPAIIIVNRGGEHTKVDTTLDENKETATIAGLLKAAMATAGN